MSIAVKIEYESAIKEITKGLNLASKEVKRAVRNALNKTARAFNREVEMILKSGEMIPSVEGYKAQFIKRLKERKRTTLKVSKAGRKAKNKAVIWLGLNFFSMGYFDNLRQDSTGAWIGNKGDGYFYPKGYIIPGKKSKKPLIAVAESGRGSKINYVKVPPRPNSQKVFERMTPRYNRIFRQYLEEEVDLIHGIAA